MINIVPVLAVALDFFRVFVSLRGLIGYDGKRKKRGAGPDEVLTQRASSCLVKFVVFLLKCFYLFYNFFVCLFTK